MTYLPSESAAFLGDIIEELDKLSKIQTNNLEVIKEKLKQKLYDNFEILNSLSNN